MADIIVTGTSGYQSGAIDTATVLQNGVSPVRAEHANGPAAAIVQIETVLGSGTQLKGAMADLAARLAVALNTTGTIKLDGFTGLTTDRGIMASSSTVMSLVNHSPVGLLSPYAGSVAPVNWLLCDGSAVSRATYAKLFAVIGTTYGVGDGSTTFNVPDLRGRTIVMVDGSANRLTSASLNGANADTLGGVGGAETHTLTLAETAANSFTINIRNSITLNGGGVSVMGSADAANDTLQTATEGGGGAHSNTQPWIALNYIIFTGV